MWTKPTTSDPAEILRRREYVPDSWDLSQVTVTVPHEIKSWLRDCAKRRGIPVSWVVVELLADGIKQIETIGTSKVEVSKVEVEHGKLDIANTPTSRKDERDPQNILHVNKTLNKFDTADYRTFRQPKDDEWDK